MLYANIKFVQNKPHGFNCVFLQEDVLRVIIMISSTVMYILTLRVIRGLKNHRYIYIKFFSCIYSIISKDCVTMLIVMFYKEIKEHFSQLLIYILWICLTWEVIPQNLLLILINSFPQNTYFAIKPVSCVNQKLH